ncbi:hypothetical protein [Devosia alba]|uniref:hypothetical protein n=1 Tax=Devosia alba TaxID=3152360 RepID=UPI00326396E8
MDVSVGLVDGLPVPLEKNAEYTIVSVDRRGVLLGLHLAEVDARCRLGFWIGRFRPVTHSSQEQDIALFRQIIAQVPAGVDA